MRREDHPNTIFDQHDGLSNAAMLFLLWVTLNTRCGMAGIYRVPARFLVEGRLNEDECVAALKELEDAGLIAYRDGVLWVRDRVAGLNNHSAQIAKSIVKDLRAVEGSALGIEFLNRYGSTLWGDKTHGWQELGSLVAASKGPEGPPEAPPRPLEMASNGQVTGPSEAPSRGSYAGAGAGAIADERGNGEDVGLEVDEGDLEWIQ